MRASLLTFGLFIAFSQPLKADPETSKKILEGFEDFISLIANVTVQDIEDTSKDNAKILDQLSTRVEELEKSVSNLRKVIVKAQLKAKELEKGVKRNTRLIEGTGPELSPPKKIVRIGTPDERAILITVRNTINKGAKLYNHPSHQFRACYNLYRNVLEILLPKLPPDLQAQVKKLIKQAASENYINAPFTLRKALDAIDDKFDPKLKFSVPKDPTKKELVRGIIDVINLGAKYHNDDNAERCYKIYRNALLDIRPHLDTPLANIVTDSLDKASSEGVVEGSWILRIALDTVKETLATSK